uniref:ORF7 protein n=1 Tax=Bat Coronavirus RaGD17 TaxID=3018878 RepID=A0AA49IEP7_9NIDO|nr:ORF7 protein [Bat Coronavirus RaGD17]
MNQIVLVLCWLICFSVLFDWYLDVIFYACQLRTWHGLVYQCNWSWSLFFEDFSAWLKCLSVVIIGFLACISFMFADLAAEVFDLFEQLLIKIGTCCRFMTYNP